MGYLVVARGGERDGLVTSAAEPPDEGTNWWWMRGWTATAGTDGPYRVTGEKETLDDGRVAFVVRFDG